jgi:hypothetical protein
MLELGLASVHSLAACSQNVLPSMHGDGHVVCSDCT